MKGLKNILFGIGMSIALAGCSTAPGSSDSSSSTSGPSSYKIGDRGPANGFIFYINPNSATDGWKYLEVAERDQNLGTYVWGTWNFTVLNADGTAIGTGRQNTQDIIANDPSINNAARACDDYSITNNGVVYDDWFLPSKDELNEMHKLKLQGIGDFNNFVHWSSSEYNNDKYEAWNQGFYTGGIQSHGQKDLHNAIRPVREF